MTKQGPDADFLFHMHRANPLELIKHGKKSFRAVRGLWGNYLIGLAICFLISLILGTLFFYLSYRPICTSYIDPWINSLIDWSRHQKWWFSWIQYPGSWLNWILKIPLLALFAYLSLRLSTFFMIYWIDKLIERIISHFRPRPDEAFSMKRFIMTLRLGLAVTFRALLYSVFFVILSFFPLIGSIIALLGISRTAGIDIMSPYLLIVGEYNNEVIKRFPFRTKPMIKVGLLQGVITIIPVFGWILMPITLILQILGYSYYCEEEWKNQQENADCPQRI